MAAAATPPNVELEAAKFLHKLIQESTDEPRKLATKLYVILQHMRSSGKENSMPYQVISRAMETVINQHGLDIEALKSSRLPLTGGIQAGESSSGHFAGSSQTAAMVKDSKSGIAENEMANSHTSSRPPVGPSGAGHGIYQGSASHLSTKSLDHESPSSYDTRSANSQPQERHDATWEKANQNDSKKATGKRKRADSSSTTEPHIENSQQLETSSLNTKKGKLANKAEPSGSFSVKGSEHSQLNLVQGSGQMERIPSLPNSMRSSSITNLMPRAANSKYPEEIEVSSAHSAGGLQQGGSRLPAHDILSPKGLWNQSRMGSSLEKSQLSRFPSNAGSGNSTAEILLHQSTAPLGSGASGKVHGATPGASGSYPAMEPGISSPMHLGSASYDDHALVAKMNMERSREAFSATPSVELSSGKAAVDSEYWKHGYTKSAVTNTSERTGEAQFFSANRAELVSSSFPAGMALEHEGRTSNVLGNANKMVQSGIPGNNMEMNMLRGATPRDTGKSPISQAAGVSNLPFKEQHLKQLRAQCLVFLAFRNGMMPKKLHLEIALGNFLPKEDGPSKELIDRKGKELSLNDPSNIPEDTMPFGRLNNGRETEIVPQGPSSSGILTEANSSKESEDPNMIQEIAESHAFLMKGSQPDSFSARGLAFRNRKDDLENEHQAEIANQASTAMGIIKQMNPEMINWTGIGTHNEAAKGSVTSSIVPHESIPERKDSSSSQSQILADLNIQRSRHSDSHLTSYPSREHWKPISGTDADHQPVKDTNALMKNGNPIVKETDQEEQDGSLFSDLLPAPKYTTSEKWIMEQQKKKRLAEQNWELKQQQTEQRIAACSDKLKETVSSSEDISAKTKSVIELKKLQLLALQRRLRSDILNDFFKPIATEMDRLKSIKKHRVGRRSKQIERFEQKMKEERQKRIRERQKEFFSEIEVHKERLDDVFKMKRERWRGFNKYIREFHKRKERIHREKIDRIQREKINLLKINDVEGYLRMVQDAKSDRVKQLLKETEKYLQKLGSKLRDAKAIERHFETDIEENRAASVFENNEIDFENEDEADQAKHYMESNEKYYLMAHSIKETIMEQPYCLKGGKLREYQMNGLRWLVSLYNNHLNGILADEMGLGKTVQVIALMCYLMETKNDRGPFLVVVPSSVLPGWESEINFWAPGINKIVYSGPPEERRRLFKERIVQQKFNVLLTTYEYLMNKHDRPKLSKVHWHYIIIDEGHRIKNASCKLNADLKHYNSSHRLLLTGTPLQNNLEELWALLNFLLPNIFNSSEDFSQWFNKPFESNGDSSADEALLSEEENLLIINRLHQVLRPFVLRRLKHKVENELPEKIERLVRCEASAYQKLLMKRVEDNLGAIGTSKARSVHNSVMELRNICNHPYLSQLHVEEVHEFVPKHYLPNIVRLCGKLEMLDRLLPKLKATDHRVLFFSTMTRLLDVMEDYLCWKQYRYLRLDGHTSGGDRGALIDQFNQPGSPFFIFLLSIRAGGVGVNLQAADTVIIFDTDWNPQVDLQAQARAHRIGQKKDVLVLRLETVQTVEEQVRAAAEHKLGVANQSITAGFFDNNTSAEDRREYLESLLRECKKEEAAPVLGDDALNDLIARSESEIDVFEAVDRQRQEEEMVMWKNLLLGLGKDGSEPIPPLPSRLLTDDELRTFHEAIKIYELSNSRVASNAGPKQKSEYLRSLDMQHYGRGKRAREVRSYEEQWTEEEFEKMCQADSPESPKLNEEGIEKFSGPITLTAKIEPIEQLPTLISQLPIQPPIQQSTEVTPPVIKRGRGRPRRSTVAIPPSMGIHPSPSGASKTDTASQIGRVSIFTVPSVSDSLPGSTSVKTITGTTHQFGVWIAPSSESTPLPSVFPGAQSTPTPSSVSIQVNEQTQKNRGGAEAPPRRRGKNQASLPPDVPVFSGPSATGKTDMILPGETVSSFPTALSPSSVSSSSTVKGMSNAQSLVSPAVPALPESSQTAKMDLVPKVEPVSSNPMVLPGPFFFPTTTVVTGVSATVDHFGVVVSPNSQPNLPVVGIAPNSQPNPPSAYDALGSRSIDPSPVPKQPKGRGRKAQSAVAPPKTDMILRGTTVSSFPTTPSPNSASSSSTVKGMSNDQSLVSSTAPVLPESSQTVKIDLVSEVEPVSSNPTVLPGPVLIPTTTVVTGISANVDNFGVVVAPNSQPNPPVVGIAPSSQPNPPSSYNALGSQSVDPSVPKQPKGRGRKPQSAVAAPPLRRGRRQSLVAAVAADGLSGENPKANNDQPGNKAAVLPARKSVCTRRQRANEAMQQMSFVQASEFQTSDGLACPVAKPTEQSNFVAQSKQQKGLSTSESQKIDAKAVEEAIILESNVAESKTLEEKKGISSLETAAAIVDSETQKAKEDVSAETREKNDPKETIVSKPVVCELETKLDVGSLVNVEDSRDRVEEISIAKTNVGITSAVPLSAKPSIDVTCEKSPASDSSVLETSALNLKMDKCEDQSGKEDEKEQQMKGPDLDDVVVSEPGETSCLEEKKLTTDTVAPLVDSAIEKMTKKEVDAQAQEINDLISHDTVVSKPEAGEYETKIDARSLENVAADPTDLIKEKSIVGNTVGGTSSVSLKKKSSVLIDTVDKCGDQFGKEDANEQEMNCPVRDDAVALETKVSKSLEETKFSTLSSFEPEAPNVDTEIEVSEMVIDAEEAIVSNDPILPEAGVSKLDDAYELQTRFNTGPVENVADPKDLGKEYSIVETNADGTLGITLNADKLDNVVCEKPPASDASVLEVTKDSVNQFRKKEDQKEQGALVVDPEIREIENTFGAETRVVNDPVLVEAVVSNPEICEPETKINAVSFENVANPRDVDNGSSIVETISENQSDKEDTKEEQREETGQDRVLGSSEKLEDSENFVRENVAPEEAKESPSAAE
ncbi:hypothetical protein U1Q18_032209 [Sarracenia purpurea var. burkii]